MSRTWREAFDEALNKYTQHGAPIQDAREWAKEDADEEFSE